MYPAPFKYYRAGSILDAAQLLTELGEEAKILAGGQSLIPLMKLRLSRPAALIDINFVSGLSGIEQVDDKLHFGALARHAAIESSRLVERVPILHDCAAGIADIQVRNRGTIGGSVAEADPSGDWTTVLSTLDCEIVCTGPAGERTIPISQFVRDAYTTALEPAELVRKVLVKIPPKNSGGAYVAFKRSAPVYATASAAVQLIMEDRDICKDARISLGCVGLTAIRATEAEATLRAQKVVPKIIESACEAAMAAAEPQSDMRGSADYKRRLVGALTKRALATALARCRGERTEVSHEYIGRA
ncbi:MAG: FAD binding domain-containing protein [Candidatus Acidiferrales bacterium]